LQLRAAGVESLVFGLQRLPVAFELGAGGGQVALLILGLTAFFFDFLAAAVPDDAVGFQLGGLLFEQVLPRIELTGAFLQFLRRIAEDRERRRRSLTPLCGSTGARTPTTDAG